MKKYGQNYWSKRSIQYDKTNWVKDKDFMDIFLSMLPNEAFHNILEIGIGTGALAEHIADYIGPLIGIDISEDMIAKINHPAITVKIGDAHNLDFDSDTFDLIYMRNVIHYINNPNLVFSEIDRCLKTGGYFLFSQVVPPDESISEEYDWLVGRNIHYPTEEEITKYFLKCSIIKKKNYILKKQSIMNWLNNTCSNEIEKQKIISRHKSSSEEYKALVNFEETLDDVLLDIRQFLILGKNESL